MLVDEGMPRRSEGGGGWEVAGDLSRCRQGASRRRQSRNRLRRACDPTVQPNLLALVRKELIPPRSSPDDDLYQFRHLLIRDAAYSSLSKDLRAELHERFAEWLSATVGDRIAEYDEIVAPTTSNRPTSTARSSVLAPGDRCRARARRRAAQRGRPADARPQ